MKNTIRVERAKLRITQKELAQEVGIAQMAVNKIENNKVDPRLGTALKIVRFFKLKIEDIFSLD